MNTFKRAILAAGFVSSLSVITIAHAADIKDGAACSTSYGKTMLDGSMIDTVDLTCSRLNQIAACSTSYGTATLDGAVIDTVELACPRLTQVASLSPAQQRR
jgi:hypothetical protein